eukprot:TRINITY_DN11941_c1_g1_i1.p1 TRINITY_DN11941_c1_g1~~TRINITY_DN11941_c1_g1_i1.p1  ORF type:complete len:541 (+),score=175.03 TRINITY_DN11941_c1_g1_i1:161-1783(+)
MFGDGENISYTQDDGKKKRYQIAGTIFIVVTLLMFIGFVIFGCLYAVNVINWTEISNKKTLVESIELSNLLNHLTELQKIADQNSDSRAINLGFNDSVSYIESQLKALNRYDIQIQPFVVTQREETEDPIFRQVDPEEITYKLNIDFRTIEYLNSGNVQEETYFVGDGCDQSNWDEFPSNKIAIMWSNGTCAVRDKGILAEKNNATGFVLINSNPNTLSSYNLKQPVSFPAISITYNLGIQFLEEIEVNDTLVLNIQTSTIDLLSDTMNLIACSKDGDENETIIQGSHLDSVPAGPGINDNGSGSAANLEVAIQWAKLKLTPVNKICFAFWSAEELGLKGSRYFVGDLVENNPEELKKIALNLNMDMIASPNYFRGIYNGYEAAEPIRAGSSRITQLYESYFIGIDQPTDLTEFDGRSDYGPFIENNIPAGGLFTGAEKIKTMEERTRYGGVAGASYDTCYHQACDSTFNINYEVFIEMSRASATVVQELAMQANLDNYLNDKDNFKSHYQQYRRSIQDKKPKCNFSPEYPKIIDHDLDR